MSLWIEDADPAGATPNAEVYYRYHDGTSWSPTAPITGTTTPNAEWETDPAAVFMSSGAALACWTANKGAKTLTDLNAILAAQDIACSYWNGTAWSAPVKIIDDTEADGTVSLTYDAANNKALAVWVHNSAPDKNAMTRTAWKLLYGIYDPVTGLWTTPQDIPGPPGSGAIQMPSIATDGSGNTLLVWARDDDGKFYTELGSITNGTNVDPVNCDSHILWSKRTGATWSSPQVLATGDNATRLSPSIAAAPGGSFLAVWMEKEPAKPKRIKYAVWSGGAWSTPGLVTESGQLIEDPKAIVDIQGKATVIWRGNTQGNGALFSSTGTMAAQINWSEPLQITHDDTIQWQPSVALDSNSKVVTSWSGYKAATGTAQSGSGFSGGVNIAATDPQSASLKGVYADQVRDVNSDGIYESLAVTVGVNLAKAGSYKVQADLYKAAVLIAKAALTRNGLSLGDQNFELMFPGGMIADRNLDGPYQLKNVLVMDFNDSPVQTAFAASPYTTSGTYRASQFVRGSLTLDKQTYWGVVNKALITVTDVTKNTNAGSAQTVPVWVASTKDGKGFSMVLTETGNDTGVFTGRLGFSTTASDPVQAKLYVADHDLVQVYYEDQAQSFRWNQSALWRWVLPGDINADAVVDITDLILAIQIISGMDMTGKTVTLEADVDGNNRIGAEEAVYILQKLAVQR